MTEELKLVCSCCGKEILPHKMFLDQDENIICSDCARYKYYRCGTCGRYIKNGYECKVCNNIYDKVCNSYSTKPTPLFINKDGTIGNRNNRYFGLEMEFSYVNPTLAKYLFKDLYKDKMIYNKSDSSLYDGVEIVTSPCDYSTIKKVINRMENGLEVIKKIRNVSKNAGVHIHVNKKSIDPIDRYKLGYLLNKMQDTEDINKLYYLVNRAKGFKNRVDDHYFQAGRTNIRDCYSSGNRYKALNFQNCNTIEFRIFKGTAEKDMLLFYIEIVNSMIDFCHNNKLIDININNFLNYIKDSNNNVCKKKIKSIERKFGKLEPKENVYKIDASILDDIPIDRYSDLIQYLKTCNVSTFKEAVKRFKDNCSVYNFGFDFTSSPIYKDLKEKARQYYINEIEAMKGVA